MVGVGSGPPERFLIDICSGQGELGLTNARRHKSRSDEETKMEAQHCFLFSACVALKHSGAFMSSACQHEAATKALSRQRFCQVTSWPPC